MRFAALLCVLCLASACGKDGAGVPMAAPTGPSPALPPVPPQTSRAISVGEAVNDALTFHGDQRVFELTAPSAGTLVVRVSWDRSRGLLDLILADHHFGPSTSEGIIVGTLPVVAGQKYRLEVADGAPWDYDNLFVPFTLTTQSTVGASNIALRDGGS